MGSYVFLQQVHFDFGEERGLLSKYLSVILILALQRMRTPVLKVQSVKKYFVITLIIKLAKNVVNNYMIYLLYKLAP